jgi:hypothetical protein
MWRVKVRSEVQKNNADSTRIDTKTLPFVSLSAKITPKTAAIRFYYRTVRRFPRCRFIASDTRKSGILTSKLPSTFLFEVVMTASQFAEALRRSLEQHNIETLAEEYRRQDEFLYLPVFLPETILTAVRQELPQLQHHTHRTNVPRIRKGGSVGASVLKEQTAILRQIYSSFALKMFLSAIAGTPLFECPAGDEHAMALYSYTEEGDFIHYHYDTSFYKGNRYTVLLTIENNSSCNLMYDLYTKSRHHAPEHHEVNTASGSLVIFNGNKLHHAVSPAGKGEQRHVLSMEYVDTQKIGLFGKLISDFKDKFAYFGFRPAKPLSAGGAVQ